MFEPSRLLSDAHEVAWQTFKICADGVLCHFAGFCESVAFGYEAGKRGAGDDIAAFDSGFEKDGEFGDRFKFRGISRLVWHGDFFLETNRFQGSLIESRGRGRGGGADKWVAGPPKAKLRRRYWAGKGAASFWVWIAY